MNPGIYHVQSQHLSRRDGKWSCFFLILRFPWRLWPYLRICPIVLIATNATGLTRILPEGGYRQSAQLLMRLTGRLIIHLWAGWKRLRCLRHADLHSPADHPNDIPNKIVFRFLSCVEYVSLMNFLGFISKLGLKFGGLERPNANILPQPLKRITPLILTPKCLEH